MFTPVTIGPTTLRNRIVKAATFEGLSFGPKAPGKRREGGLVSDALIDFHRTVAAGGVGMTTVAYCAVSPEGRGAPNEIVLRSEALEGLTRIAEAVHAEGAAISAQIGHAGPVGTSRVTGAKALAASNGIGPLGNRYHAATRDDITRITRSFADGARVLADAGFDALELHFGHHYLLNAFLSPKFNRRKDDYGGSIANRVRFHREIAQAVKGVVGDRLAVTAKWEMIDGVPRGLWLAESIEAALLLEQDGTIDAMQLTCGGSLANPMFLFRGDVPREEFAATLPPAIRLGFRVVGKRFMPEYPFEEAYFLSYARQFRDALKMPLILLGGVTELATAEAAIDEGFVAVAMGRALLREPDLPRRWQEGSTKSSLCVHCNKCMPTIYSGTHCVLVATEDRPGVRLLAR